MAIKYVPSVTMRSNTGWMTAEGVPVFLHGYNVQMNKTISSMYLKDGSTGSTLFYSGKSSGARGSGYDTVMMDPGNSWYCPNGIYRSVGGQKLCSILFEITN
jgi:hypothetical protein